MSVVRILKVLVANARSIGPFIVDSVSLRTPRRSCLGYRP